MPNFEKLLEIMAEKNISAHKLAKEIGIHPPDMYSAINGNKPMYPNYKKRICEYFEMSKRELFEEE